MKRYICQVCSVDAVTALSKAAPLAVHNVVLILTLLYGSETWILQKTNKWKMNGVEMRYIRRIPSWLHPQWKNIQNGRYSREAMKKNVLFWVRQKNKWWKNEKTIYERKVSSKREKGDLSWRLKRLMIVSEAKDVYRELSVLRSFLSNYPTRETA